VREQLRCGGAVAVNCGELRRLWEMTNDELEGERRGALRLARLKSSWWLLQGELAPVCHHDTKAAACWTLVKRRMEGGGRR
jgi:hypothetical protein